MVAIKRQVSLPWVSSAFDLSVGKLLLVITGINKLFSQLVPTMKWLYPLLLVATFAGIVYTEVLDLGDLKLYDPKIVRTQPTMMLVEKIY